MPPSGDSKKVGLSPLSGVSPESPSTFTCPECQKTFVRRENLSRHLKTHQDVKAHCCPICPKEFTRSDLLKRHLSIHERKGETGPANDGSAYPKRRRTSAANPIVNDDVAGNKPPDAGPSLDYYDPNKTLADFLSTHTQEPSQPHGPQTSWRHGADLPYDFLSSASSSSYQQSEAMENWFPNEFYAALQETGNEWPNTVEGMTSPASLFLDHRPEHYDLGQVPQGLRQEYSETRTAQMAGIMQDQIPGVRGYGRISPLEPSPPNEPWEEGKWPFSRDARNQPYSHPEAITITNDHQLYREHDPKHDISDTTYRKIADEIDFVNAAQPTGDPRSLVRLPTLSVANLFIGLFFKHFAPQMPALHSATIQVDQNLPCQLIGSMIVIGAIYSHEKHTRRFAVALLDVIRRSLVTRVEGENSMVRDPMIVYTFTLVCHVGLWCGNMRAFGFAEGVRGSMVNYCRRIGFSNDINTPGFPRTESGSLEGQWKAWIRAESHRRLCWVVYMLDYQFASLLNMPTTISISELSDLGCPCDEEFWTAPSARHWKRLLGPASVPPSRLFTAALGPFVVPPVSSTFTPEQHDPVYEGPPPLGLNTWSQFLVLLAIHNQIYQFSQDMILAGKICHDGTNGSSYSSPRGGHTFDPDYELLKSMSYRRGAASGESLTARDLAARHMRVRLRGAVDTGNWPIWHRLAATQAQLLASLDLWASNYSPGLPSTLNLAESDHFQQNSILMHQLGYILIEVSFTDLQGAIGRLDPSQMPQAMSNLSLWVTTSQRFLEIADTCVELLQLLTHNQSRIRGGVSMINTNQCSIVPCFLCFVVLWAIVGAATEEQKQALVAEMEQRNRTKFPNFTAVLKAAIGSVSTRSNSNRRTADSESKGTDPTKLIFRIAAEILTRMGTWGCSLDLAKTLHLRAET